MKYIYKCINAYKCINIYLGQKIHFLILSFITTNWQDKVD